MTLSVAESARYCRNIARRRGRNFYYTFLTLPGDLATDMCVLYAFMRECDDICDDPERDNKRGEQLDEWEQALTKTLSGEASAHPALPALRDLVERHSLPETYLRDVIAGVRMDLAPQLFVSAEELDRYCYHVAGAVGLCCIHIWGFTDPRAVPLAIDCGTALQLTNILRDIGEDASAGRVYLPQDHLQKFGLSRDALLHTPDQTRLAPLIAFEVARARQYYARGKELFEWIHPRGKPILSAMLRIYEGLLDEIERHDFNVYEKTIRVPGWRKLLISADELVRDRWQRVWGTTRQE